MSLTILPFIRVPPSTHSSLTHLRPTPSAHWLIKTCADASKTRGAVDLQVRNRGNVVNLEHFIARSACYVPLACQDRASVRPASPSPSGQIRKNLKNGPPETDLKVSRPERSQIWSVSYKVWFWCIKLTRNASQMIPCMRNVFQMSFWAISLENLIDCSGFPLLYLTTFWVITSESRKKIESSKVPQSRWSMGDLKSKFRSRPRFWRDLD